jgi:hypothetical protein
MGSHISIRCLKERQQRRRRKTIRGTLIASSSPSFALNLRRQTSFVSAYAALELIDPFPHVGRLLGQSSLHLFISPVKIDLDLISRVIGLLWNTLKFVNGFVSAWPPSA